MLLSYKVKFIQFITGQPIPPGLHVRINFQTGKKEAKLLDPDEKTDPEENTGMAISSDPQDDTAQDDHETDYSRLKEALKNIPDEGFEYSEEKLKEITKKFKSYENIKQDLADMNMTMNTDFQLMSALFEKYEKIKAKTDITLNEFGILFDDLEYLLHQIDNANDFVTSGGLEKIILPNLGNQSIPELRIHSVKLLGVLMQNNPKAQIAVFEKNVGSFLLQLLSQSNNNSTSELSSILFAFGGLLRKFPLAQEELLNNPGLKILVDLIGKQVDFKIKMKCLLLITDLIREYDEVTTSKVLNDDLSKTKQYNATDIKSRLLKTEYCTITDELFNIHRQDYLENMYSAEDMLNVVITSKDICQSFWAESPIFRHTLLVINSYYDRMKGNKNIDVVEYDEVVHKLEHLLTFLFNQTVTKDEL